MPDHPGPDDRKIRHDHHDHHHGHHHHHGPPNYDIAFAFGTVLNLAFVVIEVIYGARAHSLALVADAGHNLGDVLGLMLSWGAAVLTRRGPTKQHTYGMRRSSILAALGNAVFLLITIGVIGTEAVTRLIHPAVVAGRTVIWVAALGIIVNTTTALLFVAGRKGDLNVRSAFLHMAADAAIAGSVVIIGILITVTGWWWIDPAMSLVIVAVIVAGTWTLLMESIHLALDAVPAAIDPHAVEAYLCALPGVTEVHDLHIWGMSTTDVALTAHLIKPALADDDVLLRTVCKELHDRFGIEHATVQIERGHGPHACGLAPAHVI